MHTTMPQDDFYAKMRRGMPQLIAQWLELGQDTPERLALLLAETARVTRIGLPETTPDATTLRAWSEAANGEEVPLWAARTATFLLAQMPARPLPHDTDEACAWAYCWLRNHDFASLEAAESALPMHLHDPLADALPAAWQDRCGLRLV